MLAAGIVQDLFTREAGEGEGGYDWRLLLPLVLPLRLEILPFLSILQNSNLCYINKI